MKKINLFAVLALAVLGPLSAAAQDWKAVTHYDKAAVKKQLTDRFTKYVTFDTQSKEGVETVPSTPGQLKFAKALAKELKKNGAQNVQISKKGIVTAEIPSNSARKSPAIGLLAHLDTAAEVSGKAVKPQVHAKYNGGDIVINAEKKLVLNSSNAPQLLRAHGHDIITASGGTLLGADDKTGVAVLMTLVQFLYDYSAVKHGTIKIALTPDEEVGAGIDYLDIPAFGADYAYTLDGGNLGELTDETFNAKSFTVVFEGNRGVHPGSAQNSPFADNVLMASDFHTLLPRHKRPETTSGRKGFILVDSIDTRENRTEVKGIIRAFSDAEMDELVADVKQAFNTVKSIHYKGKGVDLKFTDQYKNMKSFLPENVVKMAKLAMEQEEITPTIHAARGGTDGSQLSANGLPTPDIFSGQFNIHSELEYADVDVMEASFRTVMRLLTLWDLQEK